MTTAVEPSPELAALIAWIVAKGPPPAPVIDSADLAPGSDHAELVAWIAADCPAPPPHLVKMETLKYYARAYGCRLFVETGAGIGATTSALATLGIECHTIELDTPRFHTIKAMFANTPNVAVHHGDSAVVLPQLLGRITQRALFWLDAHYSWDGLERAEKETPIIEEIRSILDHPVKDHVILVDDMRLFGNPQGEYYKDYPTVEQLASMFGNRPVDIEIIHDMMRITPRREI